MRFRRDPLPRGSQPALGNRQDVVENPGVIQACHAFSQDAAERRRLRAPQEHHEQRLYLCCDAFAGMTALGNTRLGTAEV